MSGRLSFIVLAIESMALQFSHWMHFGILPYLSSALNIRSTKHTSSRNEPIQGHARTQHQFLNQLESQLLGPLLNDGISDISRKLKKQIRQRLLQDPSCMLPSYTCKLPTGREKGQYLALDVGGSTLRVALVRFGGNRDGELARFKAHSIGHDVKGLVGAAFFDWMASKIVETLEEHDDHPSAGTGGDVLLSLAWSFPVDQTSLRSGLMRPMGKGFHASDGLIGQDLGNIIEAACQRAGLRAKLRVILNDGSATLMSSAYAFEATRFGLILGTGINVAAHLPISMIGRAKLNDRSETWLAEASDVIVNNEAGMFGHDILPATKWDSDLRRDLNLDLQPLEYMTSGMYLGEVARRIMLDAVVLCGLFGGVMPTSLLKEFSFSTATMAVVEGSLDVETSKNALAAVQDATSGDIEFLRRLFSLLSRRSAALVAAYVHAIWELRLEGLEGELATCCNADRKAIIKTEVAMKRTKVAFSGSVVESYPGYRETCQQCIDGLIRESSSRGYPGAELPKIDLVPATESALLGAGVALASIVDS